MNNSSPQVPSSPDEKPLPTKEINGRTITLQPDMPAPGGGRMIRCQALAMRYDDDPTGAAAGQCARPAMRGERVCDRHGGRASQRRRLERLVPEAIETYERVMAGTEKDADALKAADSVLDRTGYARRTEIGVEQARAELEAKLNELDAGGDSPGLDPQDGVESPGEGDSSD